MIMIVLGTITFCLETTYCVGFTPLADEPHLGCPAEEIKILNDMKLFETVCIVAFTIEYLTKVVCCSERLSPNPSVIRYLCKTMSLIDLAAILPFYIELFFGGDIGLSVLRMLRMTRIFRVLKVGSFANDLMIFVEGMRRAREGLILLLFLTGLYLCVFAAVLYALEYESQQECRKCSDDGYGCSCPSKLGFTSIPTTWYFIIASMTTVGCAWHPVCLG
jgi:voltage-gated potassium channel